VFASEGQLVDIFIKKKKFQQNQNSVLEEDEVDISHIQLVEDVKKLSEVLEEIEEETIEEFLNHINDLEHQGDMMGELSSETIGSYIFKTDSLYMMADIAIEKQPFEDIFRREYKEQETMLAENIVRDHQFTMIIGTIKIAMEAIEEEEHLLRDVNKEEFYAQDLAEGERTLVKQCFLEQSIETDRSIRNLTMHGCVMMKFWQSVTEKLHC